LSGESDRVPRLTIELRTEDGEVVEQIFDEGAVARVRPPLDDASSTCLRFIDPYGDTVFNPLQAGPLVLELEAKMDSVALTDDRDRIGRLIELATKCASDVHVYLWFIGD
jgi:hypothetical protein